MLLQNLKSHRTLPGNNLRIIVRMDKGHTFLFSLFRSIGIGFVVGITRQLDPCTIITNRLHLDGRRGTWHDNQRLHSQLASSQRHALRMITGRSCDNTARALLLRQARYPVICATQLERMYRLQVFALHPDPVFKARGQATGLIKRCFPGHVIDTAVPDHL